MLVAIDVPRQRHEVLIAVPGVMVTLFVGHFRSGGIFFTIGNVIHELSKWGIVVLLEARLSYLTLSRWKDEKFPHESHLACDSTFLGKDMPVLDHPHDLDALECCLR